MDRTRDLSHINKGVNQTADALIASAVHGTDEQKILLLRLFSAVKNRREFLTDVDEPLINTVRTYLVRMVRDEPLHVGSLCGIAFNKLRATLPVYLSKNIPSDTFYNSGKVADRKLSEFAGDIKNARDDGARAATLFFDRAYDVRLRLLGFALSAEYSA